MREARSPFERNVRWCWEMGLTDAEISRAVDRSASLVRWARSRMDLPANPPDVPERRMRLYLSGLNDHKIARILDVSPVTIDLWRKKRGLPPNCKVGRPRVKGAAG